jgi:hypothetical protein
LGKLILASQILSGKICSNALTIRSFSRRFFLTTNGR